MVLIGALLIVVVWGVGYYGGGYGEIIRQTRSSIGSSFRYPLLYCK